MGYCYFYFKRDSCPIFFVNYGLVHSDLEEEVETANTQSDSGLTESGQRRQHVRVSGRRRMHSETTNVMEQFSPTSNDERCRQASNLHNEREKER